MEPKVKFVSEDGVATLTLNRPAKLNALDYETIDMLMARLDEIERNGAIRAVILTGAGGRAFSAGGDITEFRESVRAGAEVALRDFVRRGQGLTSRIERFGKPIIAAVNGLAFGGGCEIVEAAHLAVAAEGVEFAKPEIKLGMPPTFGGTQRLSRLAGRKRALELLLTGRRFSTATAYYLGLISKVVPKELVATEARALADAVIQHEPDAVAAIIGAVTRGLNASIDEGLHIEAGQFARLAEGAVLGNTLDAWLGRPRAD